MPKADANNFVPDDWLVKAFRRQWQETSKLEVKEFLEQQQIDLADSDARSRSQVMQILKLVIENSAQAGELKAGGDVVRRLFEQFPHLSSDERQSLMQCEQEWLNSPRTLIVSQQDAQSAFSRTSESSAPVIQGYADLTRVGQGALGIVYRGAQLGTNRVVAIKCIRPEFEMDERARQLFVREASIASQLKHPYIVDCLSFGFCGLRPYLVMEFFPGEDLEQLVWKHDPARRVRLAVKIILRLLEALQFAHGQGVIHRDIKPQNVLARIVKGRLQLKVSDFGLAKMFETAGHSGITATGEMCGTLAYMPPEQLENSRDVKPDADVYAAVVCLYRLLTEEYPHPEGNPIEMIQRRLTEDARPPEQFNPQIPQPLIQILMQGLSRNRTMRFRTAQALSLRLKTLKLLET